MSQTKAELIKGLNINASAPATSLQIDASGNVNIDSNTLYVDATNNRVGIGTTSPSHRLHVGNTADNTKLLVSSSFEAALELQNGGGSEVNVINSAGSGNLSFRVSNSEKARLDSSGRLLVGTSSTGGFNEKLNVVRTDTTTTAVVANFFNSASTSTSKLQNAILRVSSNASGADGYLNVTDNTSHNYNFGGNNGGAYVVANTNGVRLSNGGTSWASDSDERVKDIIEPIENGLSKVSTLRAVIGRYKTDDEDKRRSFLIAQDVQAVLPEAVYDEQGTLMLAYTDTIPLLVAALKESKERIEQLEAAVTALQQS